MKYKIKVRYAIWTYETYVVDSEDFGDEWDGGRFREQPMDFAAFEPDDTNTGDVMCSTYEATVEEIPVLDQINDAVEAAQHES